MKELGGWLEEAEREKEKEKGKLSGAQSHYTNLKKLVTVCYCNFVIYALI